jgi:hypothetical protein
MQVPKQLLEITKRLNNKDNQTKTNQNNKVKTNKEKTRITTKISKGM